MKKYPDRHRKVPSRKVGAQTSERAKLVRLTGNHSLKGPAVPHQSRSRHTTRRRRFACAVSLAGSHSGHG